MMHTIQQPEKAIGFGISKTPGSGIQLYLTRRRHTRSTRARDPIATDSIASYTMSASTARQMIVILQNALDECEKGVGE